MVIFKLVSFKVLVVTPIYTTISGGPVAILNSVWSIIVMYSACCRRPGEAPKRTKMTPRFSPAEKGEREAQRIERRAWVARLFLPQLITKGRGWGARVFLPQLIYPPPTPPPSPPPPLCITSTLLCSSSTSHKGIHLFTAWLLKFL